MIDASTGRERHLSATAIHAAAAGVRQMRDLGVTTAFQDVQKARDIAVGVSPRMIQRIADAGLSGQMHDAVKPMLLKNFIDRLLVSQVGLDERKILELGKLTQAVTLERHAVV